MLPHQVQPEIGPVGDRRGAGAVRSVRAPASVETGRHVIISDFVETTKDLVAAAGDSVDAQKWLEEFDSAFARIAGRSRRVEPRRRARAFLLGLLSDVDTRSCWQLAEQAGDRTPHRMQRLLGEAVWSADMVRGDVRQYVVDELGDPGAVLILNDTGDLKSGAHTVGVQRQYTGTAGRIENA